ncbi:MAG TPA: hypothetical protein VHM31_17835 [Polyangia bacterium]|nr:hypothetical protein [Polyangia bacterium]
MLAAPLGCSSGNVNIGDTQSLGGKLSDYAADWDGYAEADTFAPSNSFVSSGSDHVHLVLDGQGNGTMQVGQGTLPAPTNPDVAYPPGIDTKGFSINGTLVEGYAYPTHATRVEAGRLQFGVVAYDIFSGWCALQTPELSGSFGTSDAGISYGCTPTVPDAVATGPSGAPDGGAGCAFVGSDGAILRTIDCGKLFLCRDLRVCSCTESACTSISAPAGLVPAQYPIALDGALDSSGKSFTGTLNIDGTRVTVHLTRK